MATVYIDLIHFLPVSKIDFNDVFDDKYVCKFDFKLFIWHISYSIIFIFSN